MVYDNSDSLRFVRFATIPYKRNKEKGITKKEYEFGADTIKKGCHDAIKRRVNIIKKALLTQSKKS